MTALKNSPQPSDRLYRFLFEDKAVRGELVTLVNTYKQMVEHHHYPSAVKKLLGDMLVATSLLTATLKIEGDISLQLQGDGPVSLAVIHGNQHQQLRGVARVREGAQIADQDDLLTLIGEGYLVVTITPEQGERYQGVVELVSADLAHCLNNYFAQSAQLMTQFFLRSGTAADGQVCLSGMLLQVLPSDQVAEQKTFFEHASQLTYTIQGEELATLPVEQILHRLYHEEDIRLFEAQPVQFLCSCSQEKSVMAVKSAMNAQEIAQLIAEQGYIEISCDYCQKKYQLTAAMFTEH